MAMAVRSTAFPCIYALNRLFERKILARGRAKPREIRRVISRDRSKCSISRVITPQRATPQFTRCVTREVCRSQLSVQVTGLRH